MAANETDDEREKLILRQLLFDEKEFLDRLASTVTKTQRFLRIDPHSGRVVLTDLAKGMTLPLQIRLLLAGRYFASRIGLVTSPKMNYKELAAELNRSTGGVSGELTGIVRDGDVERDADGLVSIPFHRIDSTIDEAVDAKPNSAEAEGTVPGTGATGTRPAVRRRSPRTKPDEEMQALLSSQKDVSGYAWIKLLKNGQDQALAGLLVARDLYQKQCMTSVQLEGLLQAVFALPVNRGRLGMALHRAKGEFVLVTQEGRENRYSLSSHGESHIEGIQQQLLAARASENGGRSREPSADRPEPKYPTDGAVSEPEP